MRPSPIPSFLYLALYFSFASPFSVSVGPPPTQCGSLNVTWTGGQAPFQIMLLPPHDVPTNTSVPSTAFNNNHGSYQLSPILFAENTNFLLIMSDATGFGTGGTSELLTVGEPVGSTSCNTSSLSPPYVFILPSSPPQQCGPYLFSGYGGAILPVTITGVIPGGDVFLLHATETSFTWVANVAAGTTVVFTMTDAQGRSGGSSNPQMVGLSNDTSCLNSDSPSSTASLIPSSTTVGSSTSSSTQTSSSSGISSGTIIGVAVGAVVAVAAIVALAVFCLKRRGRSPYGLPPIQNLRRANSVELDPGIDNFQRPPIRPLFYQTDSVSRLSAIPKPPVSPASYQETSSTSPSIPSEAAYTHQQFSRTSSNIDSFAAFGDIASSSMSSSDRRKVAMAGVSSHQPATRIIVHTDAEGLVPEVAANVIELPPRYSERPIPGAAYTGERLMPSVTGLSSTDLAYLSARGVNEPPRSTRYSPLE